MNWDTIIPGTQEVDAADLARQIIDVFHDGFNLPRRVGGWSVEQAAAMIERCTVVQVLTEGRWPTGRLDGYACYVCPEAAVRDGAHLLWEDAICLRKPYQFAGLSGEALANALFTARNLGRATGYIGGRTQNPSVMLRYSRWGTLYPVDESYETASGVSLMAFLLEQIREVQSPDIDRRLDRRTGVIRQVYSEGRLGDYAIPDDPRVAKWESRLKANGFDRDRGDAVALVARIERSDVLSRQSRSSRRHTETF